MTKLQKTALSLATVHLAVLGFFFFTLPSHDNLSVVLRVVIIGIFPIVLAFFRHRTCQAISLVLIFVFWTAVILMASFEEHCFGPPGGLFCSGQQISTGNLSAYPDVQQ